MVATTHNKVVNADCQTAARFVNRLQRRWAASPFNRHRGKYMMLIDEFMPRYDIHARYQIDIHAPISEVYSVARFLDMRNSEIIRWLYRLRGLPQDGLTLDGMLKWGFVLLADEPSQEVVFGLIGRFWTLYPQIQHTNTDAFINFDKPGFAKAVGNMSFIVKRDGTVRVATETRVHCPDHASRRCFRLYWLLISPFSGIIRKEWLRLIKQQAEALSSHAKEDMYKL